MHFGWIIHWETDLKRNKTFGIIISPSICSIIIKKEEEEIEYWYEVNRAGLMKRKYRTGSDVCPEVRSVLWKAEEQPSRQRRGIIVPCSSCCCRWRSSPPRPTLEGLSTQKHGCVWGGHGQRLHRRGQHEMPPSVSAPVTGNNQTHYHGVDQRSEDEHPVHRRGMWEDSPQHARSEHASGQVTQDQGKRDSSFKTPTGTVRILDHDGGEGSQMSTLALWERRLPVTQQGDTHTQVTTNSSQLIFALPSQHGEQTQLWMKLQH